MLWAALAGCTSAPVQRVTVLAPTGVAGDVPSRHQAVWAGVTAVAFDALLDDGPDGPTSDVLARWSPAQDGLQVVLRDRAVDAGLSADDICRSLHPHPCTVHSRTEATVHRATADDLLGVPLVGGSADAWRSTSAWRVRRGPTWSAILERDGVRADVVQGSEPTTMARLASSGDVAVLALRPSLVRLLTERAPDLRVERHPSWSWAVLEGDGAPQVAAALDVPALLACLGEVPGDDVVLAPLPDAARSTGERRSPMEHLPRELAVESELVFPYTRCTEPLAAALPGVRITRIDSREPPRTPQADAVVLRVRTVAGASPAPPARGLALWGIRDTSAWGPSVPADLRERVVRAHTVPWEP